MRNRLVYAWEQFLVQLLLLLLVMQAQYKMVTKCIIITLTRQNTDFFVPKNQFIWIIFVDWVL